MSITWMKSEKHGYMPCSNGLEIEAAKKAGWVECGPPPWPKPGVVVDVDEGIDPEALKVAVENLALDLEADALRSLSEEHGGFDPNAIVMSEGVAAKPSKKPKAK